MNEAMVTVAGNAATPVEYRETTDGVGMARFRLATTVRRFDRRQETWVDAYTSFYTVVAWRGLAANLAASVTVGEPLLVRGRLRVREAQYEGRFRVWAEIEAVAAGHDLSRGTSAFRRVSRARQHTDGTAEDVPDDTGSSEPAQNHPDNAKK